jgi:hypothetical protein
LRGGEPQQNFQTTFPPPSRDVNISFLASLFAHLGNPHVEFEMSRPPFKHTHTAYLIDDRLYATVPYPEMALQAAQRLSKTWAFKTRPQAGIVFPRVPAGYAFEQANPDIGSSRFTSFRSCLP